MEAAAPRSALDLTKTYGMLCSSQYTGMCEITSSGVISAAITQILENETNQIDKD